MTPVVANACRSPLDRTLRSRRRSRRQARPGSTADCWQGVAAEVGAEVREVMDRRIDHRRTGFARRQGRRVIFARDLIHTLRRRELDEAASKLSAQSGLAHRTSAEGERVSGIYRQRVTLASGRFAMIDDGIGFQLVTWRPALGRRLGQQCHAQHQAAGSTGASSASAGSATVTGHEAASALWTICRAVPSWTKPNASWSFVIPWGICRTTSRCAASVLILTLVSLWRPF